MQRVASWAAGALIPSGLPVTQAAKYEGAQQHPGHVDGLSQVAEGAGLTHQVPLRGREGRSSHRLRQTPPHAALAPSDLHHDGGWENAVVVDPAVFAGLCGCPMHRGVWAQEGPLRLCEAPAWLGGSKLVQRYGGP